MSFIARDEHTLSVTEHDMRRALMRLNTRKAVGSDGISGQVLKTCANQLAQVFTTIFNLSLAESVVPAYFKWSTIVPVPKTASSTCLNDQLVALILVVMKRFERLITDYICTFLPPSMDPNCSRQHSSDRSSCPAFNKRCNA